MKLPGFPELTVIAGIDLVIFACAKLVFSGQLQCVIDLVIFACVKLDFSGQL
jgi:hypothetical protein